MRLALTSIALVSTARSMATEPRRSFGTEIASASPKPPRFVDVDKYDVADGAAARAHLDERGFVVFRGVLDASEVARANELFFDYLEALGSGVGRNDVNTWGDDRWPPCAGATCVEITVSRLRHRADAGMEATSRPWQGSEI